ncbi:MAG: AAA family ATPase [Actinomycetota bacterium]
MELVEREVEFTRLQAALDAATDGSGRVVLVRGEPGIGKTALIRAFVDQLPADGPGRPEVLLGRCDDLATPRELGPIWDLAASVPPLAAALASGDRAKVYVAALDLIGRPRTTVILLEDLHWADAATLDLVKVIGRRIDTARALLVATYRDDDVVVGDRIRAVVGDLPPHAVERLALEPLGPDGVRRLAEGTGRDADRLLAESDGNPFFVAELLSSADGEVPASVEDATRSRAAQLSPVARALVEQVAVVPRAAPVEVAAAVEGWSDAVDEAVARGLVEYDGSVISFRHQLARRAIVAGLPAARRRQLNATALAVLTELRAPAAEIVHHAEEAGDVDAIVAHAPEAARQAAAAESHTQALEHYRRLGPHLDRFEPRAEAELLDAWSRAAIVEVRIEEALDLARRSVARWRQLGDDVALADELGWLSRAAWSAGERAEAEAASAEAIALLEPAGPSSELANALSTRAQLEMLAFDHADAVATAERALAIVSELGDRRFRANILVNRGSAMAMEAVAGGDEALVEAIGEAAALDDLGEVIRGRVNRAWAFLVHRRLDDAVEELDGAIAEAVAHDLFSFELYGAATRALVQTLTGDWHAVEDLAPGLAREEPSRERLVLLPAVGIVRARRGVEGASELLDQAWRLASASRELQRTAVSGAAVAELAWIDDRLDEIGPIVLPVLDEALRVSCSWFAGALAYWAWKAGALDVAPAGISEPHRLQIEGRWQEAADRWHELGMPYERALALAEGDTDARLEALRLLDELGAEAVAAKLRSELRADGVRQLPRGPRPSTRGNPAGLTARQVEVVELLAVGRTNPEIADQLFISPRTVDHHVSAILAKLDVATRDEAVAAAADLGVVTPVPADQGAAT